MSTLNIIIVSKYKLAGNSDWIYRFFPGANSRLVNQPASNDDSSYNDILFITPANDANRFHQDYHVELFSIDCEKVVGLDINEDKVWVICPSVNGDEISMTDAMRRCHSALGDLYDIDYTDVAACDYGIRLGTNQRCA